MRDTMVRRLAHEPLGWSRTRRGDRYVTGIIDPDRHQGTAPAQHGCWTYSRAPETAVQDLAHRAIGQAAPSARRSWGLTSTRDRAWTITKASG